MTFAFAFAFAVAVAVAVAVEPMLVTDGCDDHLTDPDGDVPPPSPRPGPCLLTPSPAQSSVARGWRGSYMPISPPPGRRSLVSRPHRASVIGWVNSTPFATSSLTVASTSSHIR